MTTRILSLALTLLVAGSGMLSAQVTHPYDHVLNDQGASRLTVATGIPYLAIGEYAYGVSDRVTVGFLAGVTPSVEGYGVRVRTVLHQSDPGFRIYFCTPVFFYPNASIGGHGAWWLARPNINFEWMTPQGFRYKVGGSLIGVVSQRELTGNAREAPQLWNAVHGGISFPVGAALTLQLEASLVLRGLKVAGPDWVGGPPVILVLGTSWAL